jgi:hypothetical protein
MLSGVIGTKLLARVCYCRREFASPRAGRCHCRGTAQFGYQEICRAIISNPIFSARCPKGVKLELTDLRSSGTHHSHEVTGSVLVSYYSNRDTNVCSQRGSRIVSPYESFGSVTYVAFESEMGSERS